jgi:osmotically-inducible protein OsmY
MGSLSRRGAVILTAALGMVGCGGEDTEQLAKVARRSAARFEEMTGGAPNKVADSLTTMRANWNELALDARVSLRLRWDKDLQGAQIQVHASNGSLELKGSVRDLAQRQRAVQLAQTTVGVADVRDGLEMTGE